MDAARSDSKKWFVFLAKGQEGPFTESDIVSMLKSAHISESTFVWAYGMNDWAELGAVSALQLLVMAARRMEMEDESLQLDIPSELRSGPSGLIPPPLLPSQDVPKEEPAPLVLQLDFQDEHFKSFQARPSPPLPPKKSKFSFRVVSKIILRFLPLVLFFYVIFIARQGRMDFVIELPIVVQSLQKGRGAIAPAVAWTTHEYPGLVKIASQIPDLPDVENADLEALRRVSLPQFDAHMPGIALALTTGAKSSMYLASSLPSGAKLDVLATGTPDSLLDAFSASALYTATIDHHLSRIELNRPSGEALPTGSYEIRIVASAQQPPGARTLFERFPSWDGQIFGGSSLDEKILLKRTIFLGQPRGEAYVQAVKEFHSKVREQAAQELAELGAACQNMQETLDAAAARSRSHHSHRGKTSAGLPPSTMDPEAQPETLDVQVTRWTTDDFRGRAYYGSLYSVAAQAGEAVLRYSQTESQLAADKGNATTLEIRLGEALSVAQTEILNLRSKIDLAERTATTGELPQREGL
jgi:hypothetical protein